MGKETISELEKLVKNTGLPPIKSSRGDIIVIDLQYVPSEMRGTSISDVEKYYGAISGCRILLVDGSRVNYGGNLTPPAYIL